MHAAAASLRVDAHSDAVSPDSVHWADHGSVHSSPSSTLSPLHEEDVLTPPLHPTDSGHKGVFDQKEIDEDDDGDAGVGVTKSHSDERNAAKASSAVRESPHEDEVHHTSAVTVTIVDSSPTKLAARHTLEAVEAEAVAEVALQAAQAEAAAAQAEAAAAQAEAEAAQAEAEAAEAEAEAAQAEAEAAAEAQRAAAALELAAAQQAAFTQHAVEDDSNSTEIDAGVQQRAASQGSHEQRTGSDEAANTVITSAPAVHTHASNGEAAISTAVAAKNVADRTLEDRLAAQQAKIRELKRRLAEKKLAIQAETESLERELAMKK